MHSLSSCVFPRGGTTDITGAGEMYVHASKFMHSWFFLAQHLFWDVRLFYKSEKINYSTFYLCLPEKWNNSSNKIFMTEAAVVNLCLDCFLFSFIFATTYCLFHKPSLHGLLGHEAVDYARKRKITVLTMSGWVFASFISSAQWSASIS